MSTEAWTIPFDNITHVCWRDENNTPRYRKMTEQEDYEYFTSNDKEKYLNELLRK